MVYSALILFSRRIYTPYTTTSFPTNARFRVLATHQVLNTPIQFLAFAAEAIKRHHPQKLDAAGWSRTAGFRRCREELPTTQQHVCPNMYIENRGSAELDLTFPEKGQWFEKANTPQIIHMGNGLFTGEGQQWRQHQPDRHRPSWRQSQCMGRRAPHQQACQRHRRRERRERRGRLGHRCQWGQRGRGRQPGMHVSNFCQVGKRVGKRTQVEAAPVGATGVSQTLEVSS